MTMLKKYLPRTAKAIEDYKNAERGAVAVEFSLIIIPFLLLLFGTLEVGLMLMAILMMNMGSAEIAREIRVGTAQASGMTEAQFVSRVCSEAFTLVNCNSRLRADLRTFPNWNSAALPPDLVDNAGPGNAANWDDGLAWDPNSGASQIVMVRVMYEWNVMTPLIGAVMRDSRFSGPGENKFVLSVGQVFLNEPFGG
jgi:Flp pilus assembly protein TadG